MKRLALGDPVLFEGLNYRVTAIAGALVAFESDLVHEKAAKKRTKVVPRFRVTASIADLRWSDDLGAWYLWGRLLGKVRADVGTDARQVVAALRDRRLLPARETRERGAKPAGGEHLNLYCALFRSGVDWDSEMERLGRGEKLSDAAARCCADYAERFKAKLADGYADPGANDSYGAEG